MIMKPFVCSNLIIVCNPSVKLNMPTNNITQTAPNQNVVSNNIQLNEVTNNASRNSQSQRVNHKDEIFDNKQACKYCGKIYPLWQLKDHIKREEKLYFCHHCETQEKFTHQELVNHCLSVGIDFKRKDFFKLAMKQKKKTTGDSLKYKYCGTVYNTLEELQPHLRNEEKIYYCHHCESQEKLTRQELVDHCISVGIDFKQRNFFKHAEKAKKKITIDDLTCKHCNTVYKTLEELQYHLTNEEKIYYCHHCEFPTKITKQELINHCISVGINYKRDKFFRAAASVNARKNVINVFYCEICSAEFDDKKLIEQHYEESHKNHYKCEMCDEGFKKLLEYIFHMQTHSDDDDYKCALCNYSSPSRNLIHQHLKCKHDRFMNYRCKECGKGFSIISVYEEHTKYFHKGERPFQCDHCGRRYLHSGYLKTHIAYVHKTRTPQDNKCRVCGETFPTYRDLKNHRRKVHKKEGYVCEICGKIFDTIPLLSIHSKIHTGEKAFACKYCEKKFRRRYLLVLHERVHTGEKPYVCKYCGKCFSQSSTLVIHTRRHTGERPYVCELCKKAYASRNLLTNHRKSCKGSSS